MSWLIIDDSNTQYPIIVIIYNLWYLQFFTMLVTPNQLNFEFCFLLNYVVLGFLLLLRTLKSIVEISVGMFKTIITMLLSIHQSIWMIATSFVIHSYNIPIKKYHIIHSQICCGRQNNLSNACKQVTISSYLILLFLLQASSN